MKPTIGRIVHLNRGANFKPSAAIIAGINPDETVNLAAFNEGGAPFNAVCVRGPSPDPGCWNWPPREGDPGAPVAAGTGAAPGTLTAQGGA